MSGKSATYIQYSFARANSLIEKSNNSLNKFNYKDLTNNYEFELIKELAKFPLIVDNASQIYKPHLIANYAYDVSSIFNQFYNQDKIIKGQKSDSTRIHLVQSYMNTVKNAMYLLGINLPKKM